VAPGEPRGLWDFADTRDVAIVSASVPQDLRAVMGSCTDPGNPDYVELYSYADPDALVEVYAYLRSANPDSSV
jgi:hypothetical protein